VKTCWTLPYKVLIIGLGSVAQKHIKALGRIDPEAQIMALRSHSSASAWEGIDNIFSYTDIPEDVDFILVSNPTSEHYQTIEQILDQGIKKPLFIEKPPFHSLEGTNQLLEKIKKAEVKTYTAFNFRFHPVIQWLKANTPGKRLLEVQAYCGSYLPEWRPGRDYRKIYSAQKDKGGGVHLDLIHELDYLLWLLGNPQEVKSHLSKVSDLAIDSVDCAHYWLAYEEYNTGITLNYYRPFSKRTIEWVFEDDVWWADLINGSIKDHRGSVVYQADLDVQQTYEDQMQYFLNHLNEQADYMNDLFTATETLKTALS
jgi:predicted dehydrogenase